MDWKTILGTLVIVIGFGIFLALVFSRHVKDNWPDGL